MPNPYTIQKGERPGHWRILHGDHQVGLERTMADLSQLHSAIQETLVRYGQPCPVFIEEDDATAQLAIRMAQADLSSVDKRLTGVMAELLQILRDEAVVTVSASFRLDELRDKVLRRGAYSLEESGQQPLLKAV